MTPYLVAGFGYAATSLALISYAWLTLLAFRRGIWWGVVLVLFFPLAGVCYVFTESNTKPLYLFFVAALLAACGMALMDL